MLSAISSQMLPLHSSDDDDDVYCRPGERLKLKGKMENEDFGAKIRTKFSASGPRENGGLY